MDDRDPKQVAAETLSLDESEILSARFDGGADALIVVTKSGQKIKVSEGKDGKPEVDVLIGPGRETEEVSAPSAQEASPQEEDLPPLEGVSADSPLPAVEDEVSDAARHADAGEGPGDVDRDEDIDEADFQRAGESNLGEPEGDVVAQPDEAQAPAAAQLNDDADDGTSPDLEANVHAVNGPAKKASSKRRKKP